MYIPQKLIPFFTENDKNTKNNRITGHIKCCSQSEFDILYYGKINKSLFGRLSICDADGGLIIVLQCKKCGKKIEIFNSFTDGYDNRVLDNKNHSIVSFQQFYCKNHSHSNFSVSVTFEYLPIEELIENEIIELGNAFTWIWITFICNNCNHSFTNIVNYETA